MIINEMVRIHIALSKKAQKEIAEDIGISSSSLGKFATNKSEEGIVKILLWLFKPEGTEEKSQPETGNILMPEMQKSETSAITHNIDPLPDTKWTDHPPKNEDPDNQTNPT